MLCQTCSAPNDDDREFCYRCQNKLLVLSGVTAFEEAEIEDYEDEEDLSLDEHLLERVSGLEEIVKRSAETLRSIAEAVQKHERAIFVNQTGLLSAKELLEKKNVISSDELVVPHPLMHERRFVLEPLAEIAPDLIHPTLGVSIADLLTNL